MTLPEVRQAFRGDHGREAVELSLGKRPRDVFHGRFGALHEFPAAELCKDSTECVCAVTI